ncbi:MAG TPA: HDIG domain-containing protein [Bacteroidales bacterium]|nr:HDIG domain-containing protein [Bacteroidales bacterium]HPT01957.1 HDIG domain-containing protein [Bacteroidales bacterium]
MKFRINGSGKYYYEVNKALLFLAALAVLVSIFPRQGKLKSEFQKGKPWQHEELIAPFDFAIRKSESELQQERREILNNAYLYFRFDRDVAESQRERFIQRLSEEWKQKHGNSDQATLNEMQSSGLKIIDTLFSHGIIEMTDDLETKDGDFKIALLQGNVATIFPLNHFFTVRTANAYISRQLASAPPDNSALTLQLLQESIAHNVLFSEALNREQREQALRNISVTRGMVQKGEKIISNGELVTDEKYRVLESYRDEYETRIGRLSDFRMALAGRIILISVALIVFALFMHTFRRDIFIQNHNIVLLLSLITIMVSATTFIVNRDVSWLNAVPLCLVPIIVRTFYDTRLALFVHIITIIILGFIVPNSFEFLYMQLIAGIITIISVTNLTRRSQFFFTSLWIFCTYSVIYIGMTLLQEASLSGIYRFNFVLFGISALLTLFSYPLIFLFEGVFGMVTDVSLIELSDTHSKLLRELSVKAPGTFQHSMMVSNIAEDAARAVGANTLLTRTGAMYHDIGKMDMPLYFIENQTGTLNPHDELASDESARIIISHVIRGIEKARQYKLPEPIIDFIRTHHGTRYTQYFYSAYKLKGSANPVDESVFIYPGPVPFSKETSILMMADSVEAASRSLKSPDEQKISEIVENIINDQLKNGQFVSSELTLKDISVIKKIIKKKLMSIHHVRIEYPAV